MSRVSIADNMLRIVLTPHGGFSTVDPTSNLRNLGPGFAAKQAHTQSNVTPLGMCQMVPNTHPDSLR